MWPSPFPGVIGGLGLETGDLNADGFLDVVVGHTSSANTVGAWLGDGSGGFVGPVQSAVPGANYPLPWAMAVADFNADGLPDLAIGHAPITFFDYVKILSGDGSGSFQPWLSPYTAFPSAISAGDLDSDGDADLVVTNGGGSPIITSTLFNQGGAGFALAPSPCDLQLWSLSSGGAFQAKLGDVDGDGSLDLSVGSTPFQIGLWTSTGCFLSPYWWTVNPPYSGGCFFAWGDFDVDGADDVVIVAEGYSPPNPIGDIALFLRSAPLAPIWNPGPILNPPGSPLGVCASDLDLDGDSDFAISYVASVPAMGNPTPSGNRVTVFENVGTGPAFQQIDFTEGVLWNPARISTEDVNGDGWMDLLFTQHGIPGTDLPGFAVMMNAGGFADLESIGAATVGREVHLYLRGTPSTSWVLFASPALGTPFGLPGFSGLVSLDLTTAFPVSGGTFPADGNTLFPVAIPANPALVGQTAYLQHVSYDAATMTGVFSALLSATVN
ncbi:MAG: VCBS repeat-containing protein [Planctomycetes bacterium]|nr:VCBS repeat-containing protein [Planctomycetota bacterium]